MSVCFSVQFCFSRQGKGNVLLCDKDNDAMLQSWRLLKEMVRTTSTSSASEGQYTFSARMTSLYDSRKWRLNMFLFSVEVAPLYS